MKEPTEIEIKSNYHRLIENLEYPAQAICSETTNENLNDTDKQLLVAAEIIVDQVISRTRTPEPYYTIYHGMDGTGPDRVHTYTNDANEAANIAIELEDRFHNRHPDIYVYVRDNHGVEYNGRMPINDDGSYGDCYLDVHGGA